MRRAAVLFFLALAWLALPATPAHAGENGAPSGPAVETEGELNEQGYRFVERIAYNEEGERMGSNTPEPEIYRWRSAYAPFTAIDPINGITYCPDGQYHLIAWRVLTAYGAAVTGFTEGTTIIFWENDLLTGVRIPGTENLIADGGVDSNHVWFVHVCVGPGTPAVEDAISGLIPEPIPGLSPEPGFGGVTGFETWAWYEQDPSYGPDPNIDDIELVVRDPRWGIPYTVDAHLWAYEFEWSFGDGTPPMTVTRPGHDEALPFSAAAVHTFETKGSWFVSLRVSWTGEYTYTGYTGTEVVGPTDRSVVAGYAVKEVVTRSVPDP